MPRADTGAGSIVKSRIVPHMFISHSPMILNGNPVILCTEYSSVKPTVAGSIIEQSSTMIGNMLIAGLAQSSANRIFSAKGLVMTTFARKLGSIRDMLQYCLCLINFKQATRDLEVIVSIRRYRDMTPNRPNLILSKFVLHRRERVHLCHQVRTKEGFQIRVSSEKNHEKEQLLCNAKNYTLKRW